MATGQGQFAIPLVLPDSCNWVEQTGKYEQKPNVARETLNVVTRALDLLREIKGPVCVVSIAGPCRKGKSYIISKAFDQGEVFPLGHLLDPETMGIWMWVVPKKFKDSKGYEFTVVLLDSEGIDSVLAKHTDDSRVFTLSVLLSSIMIYNSVGVPNRSDLEGLDFIVKLSQRIQLHTNQTSQAAASHFYESFPNFIWLLRDVVLDLPTGCANIKEYFLKNVFNADKEGSEKSIKTAESILKYFRTFDAFCLPPPAYDPKVVKNLNDKTKEAQVNPQFLKDIESFKVMLHSKLSPKKSINEGEYVTGEALAALVQLFVEALNTPGAVPNVQNAWDTFVLSKCTEVLNTAVMKYRDEMTSRVGDKIPCEADVIRAAHGEVMDMCFEMFHQETFSLSIKSVDKFLKELTEKTESILLKWIDENKCKTETYCINLLKHLKKTILDPVLAQLRGPKGAKMHFNDIVTAYNRIQQDYAKDGRGAKDVQATVFMNFHPELQNEMERHIGILQQMKDYDASLAKEKAEKAAQEEHIKKAEEESSRLKKEKEIKEREMVILQDKQEAEKIRIQEMFEKNVSDQHDQLTNMMQAHFDEQRREREAAHDQQKTMENMIDVMKTSLEKRDDEIALLQTEIEAILNEPPPKGSDICIIL